jgi:hypothetical protein
VSIVEFTERWSDEDREWQERPRGEWIDPRRENCPLCGRVSRIVVLIGDPVRVCGDCKGTLAKLERRGREP